MITIILGKEEFNQAFTFVKNLESEDAVKIFSGIFDEKNRYKHGTCKFYETNVEITLDDDISMDVLSVLSKNAFNIGQCKKYSGLTLINRIKRLYTNGKTDISRIAEKIREER